MGLETGSYISDLVVTNPLGTDQKSLLDNHIRLIKTTLKNTFIDIASEVTVTHTEIDYLSDVTSNVQAQLGTKVSATATVLAGTLVCNAATDYELDLDTASLGQAIFYSYDVKSIGVQAFIHCQTVTGGGITVYMRQGSIGANDALIIQNNSGSTATLSYVVLGWA